VILKSSLTDRALQGYRGDLFVPKEDFAQALKVLCEDAELAAFAPDPLAYDLINEERVKKAREAYALVVRARRWHAIGKALHLKQRRRAPLKV